MNNSSKEEPTTTLKSYCLECNQAFDGALEKDSPHFNHPYISFEEYQRDIIQAKNSSMDSENLKEALSSLNKEATLIEVMIGKTLEFYKSQSDKLVGYKNNILKIKENMAVDSKEKPKPYELALSLEEIKMSLKTMEAIKKANDIGQIIACESVALKYLKSFSIAAEKIKEKEDLERTVKELEVKRTHLQNGISEKEETLKALQNAISVAGSGKPKEKNDDVSAMTETMKSFLIDLRKEKAELIKEQESRVEDMRKKFVDEQQKKSDYQGMFIIELQKTREESSKLINQLQKELNERKQVEQTAKPSQPSLSPEKLSDFLREAKKTAKELNQCLLSSFKEHQLTAPDFAKDLGLPDESNERYSTTESSIDELRGLISTNSKLYKDLKTRKKYIMMKYQKH